MIRRWPDPDTRGSGLRTWPLLVAWAVLAGAGAPAVSHAQVFLASRPNPAFTVGPVSIRADVTPRLGPIDVRVLWSLVVPAGMSAADVEQDIYLLWPGRVDGETVAGSADAELAAHVRERGFTVVHEGRLPLAARPLYGGRDRPRTEPIAGGAPFVSYVRDTGAIERSPAATWIRIPWTPVMVNRTYLVELRMRLPQLVRERRASALENFVWGRRYSLALSFSDVRTRAMFPVYFELRDRVIHLAEDPSQLTVTFANSDRLKIHEMTPPTVRRQSSETRAHTEILSAYLDPSEGLRPQVLTVQFGYFTDWTSWAPVLFAALFFVLGNVAGPLVTMLARKVGARFSGRIHFGRGGTFAERQTGTLIARETLARIEPGVTAHEEVLRLCGSQPEEHEQLAAPERRVLVYRGRRIVPQRRSGFGWVTTVGSWDVEHHEVEITLERGVVQDVQARVRRTHLTDPEGD
jgi:hypothetical protein